MSGISSSVGMISGLNHQDLVQQLLAIEARPRDQILRRIAGIDAQKTAYLDISARISALLSNVQMLAQPTTFSATTATSSNSDVLTATSRAGATPGAYRFSVQSLAATHQLVSRGYSSRGSSLSAGTVTIESAQARVNRDTDLSELNGYAGVQRGSFRITNAAGNSATINIATAATLSDVVAAINEAGINVTASIRGDGLMLTDNSTGTGALRVSEINDGGTAADLGFVGSTALDSDGDGELRGSALMFLTAATPLAALNDGLGIRTSIAGGDFQIGIGTDTVTVNLDEVIKDSTRLDRLNHGQGVALGTVRITSRDGTIANVDLTGLDTVGEVRTALKDAFGDDRLTVSLSGSRLVITDNAELDDDQTAGGFMIEDISGTAAHDLGLTEDASGATLTGRDILHVESVGDLLAAINYAANNADASGAPLVTAALSTDGMALTLSSADGSPLTLTAGANMRALEDLGFADGASGATLTGQRIVSGADTTLLRTLNGGAGVGTGTVRIEANSQSVDVDLSTAATLADVIELINSAATSAGLNIAVGYDNTGTRLKIAHQAGGSGTISISDVGDGDFAASIGLVTSGTQVRSANLQRQYISENTLLSELNAGSGVQLGRFSVTTTNGVTEWIDLGVGVETIGDVIREINDNDVGITARINDTGDGLLIEDTNDGSSALRIEEGDGTTAGDLNIIGSASGPGAQVDGSFEYQLEVGGGDTLESFARRIGEETSLANATLLNDGSVVAPFRLSVTSRISGLDGELIIDEGDTGLGIATLTQAQDARLLFGGDANSGVLLTSSDNTFRDVVDGLDVTVNGTSDQPATVNVARNVKNMTSVLADIVSDYNAAIDRISQAGDFDPETEEGGPLLGESTLRTVENRLYRMFTRRHFGTGSGLTSLADVGISQDSGGKLAFDQAAFTEAFESDPEAVLAFFTDQDKGFAHTLVDDLEAVANADGLIDKRTDTLNDRKELYQDRVERMNELLERKEQRLLRQFQAMEAMLAELQSQQTALADLASTAGAGFSLGGL